MPTDREKEIDFTTTRNIIKFCALAKIEPFSFKFIAKKMNAEPAFLRYWNQKNQGLITR